MGAAPGKPTNDPVNYFAFGFQSAKGTPASTFHFLKHLDGSGFEVEKEIQREREGGDNQEVGLTYVSMVKADGNVNVNSRPNVAARLFAAVLGADSVGTAAVASVARHTIVPAASLPYLTFEQRFSDEIERTQDGAMTQLTLEGEAGRPWKISGQFVSGGTVFQRDVASTLTVVRDTGKPHYFPGGSYIFDGGASYAADVTKIKVDINRGVDDGVQTTGLGRDDVIPLNFDASVDCTIKYTSRDFYQKVTYNGGSTVIQDLPTGSIDLVSPCLVPVASGVIGSGILRVLMPLIEWTDAKVNKLDPDGKTVYLDLVGMTVKGATHSVIVTADSGELTDFA